MGKSGPIAKKINEAQAKQAAALALLGHNKKSIREDLQLNQYQIDKIWNSDIFKNYLKEIGDDATNAAKHTIRSRISAVADDVFAALVYQLRERNSIEAVKVALRIMGFDEEEQEKRDTNIQVILPGHKPPEESIDARYTVQNEED